MKLHIPVFNEVVIFTSIFEMETSSVDLKTMDGFMSIYVHLCPFMDVFLQEFSLLLLDKSIVI